MIYNDLLKHELFELIQISEKITIIKSTLRKGSVYRTYNRICVLDINAHNDQDYAGFELTLLFSTQELKQSALTVWLERLFSKLNSGKCVDILSNDVATLQKIMNEQLKLEYRLHICRSRSMKYKTII